MTQPIDGQQYTLIGDGSTPSIARGDSWEACRINYAFKNVSHLSGVACGTSLQGYVRTTYSALTRKLGQPLLMTPNQSDGKVLAEWIISDPSNVNDVLFTVYCWKEDRIPHDLHYWHIGGKKANTLELFTEVTGAKTLTYEEYSAELLAGIKARREKQPVATQSSNEVEVCF